MKIKQKTKAAAWTVALVCALSVPVFAQDNSDIETIKSAMSRYLADLKQKDVQNTLRTEGDILVEYNQMYYAITLPDISFAMGEMGRFDAGNVVANISRNDKGNWRVSMAFPQTMTWNGENGEVNGLLTLGKQDITGTWDSNFEFFSNLSAQIDDIRFVDRVNRMDIGARTAKRNLVVNKQGERSSTVSSTANLYDISGKMLAQGGEFTANQMAFSVKHTGVQLMPYLETLKTLLVGGEGWTVQSLMKLSDNFTDGEQSMIMTGLHYNGGAGGINGTVGSVKMANTIETTENGLKNYGITALWSGIKPADSTFPVFPESLSLKAGLTNVDKEQLGDILASLPTAQGKASLDTFLETFEETAATMKVDEFELVMNNGSRFKVGGSMAPNPNLPGKWIGKVQVSATGVEQFAQDIVKLADSLDAEKAQKLRMMAMQVQMATMAMQSMGTGGRDASGRTVISLAFEMTPEGKMLINGQEIQSSLGNVMGTGATVQSGEEQKSVPDTVAPAQ